MKKNQWLLIFLISLFLFMYLGTRFAFRTRANNINLNLKLKLQGVFQPDVQLKLRIDLYTQSGRVAQFQNVMLKADSNNYFTGLVILEQNLDLSVPYALFIKPENYLGQLFCSQTKSGQECQYPEIILSNSLTSLDLSQKPFFSGDLVPQDGKVDSGDLSRLFRDIGKTNSPVDINLDGIVNGVDYALAQKTLSLNLADDPISLAALSPTPAAPTPTGIVNNPTPLPTATPTPTPAATPTLVPQATRGRCNGTVTGQVKVRYLGITECRVLNESDYRCVDSASECTPSECVSFTKEAIRESLQRCGAGLATFDEANSTINCQVNFVPDASCQDPTPSTSCDDTSPKCP